MIQILEYIKQNYTLFLIGLVLILLAIIGYYADKTIFGQEKNKDQKLKEIDEDTKKIINNDQEEQKNILVTEENNEIIRTEEQKETSVYNSSKEIKETEENRNFQNNEQQKEQSKIEEIKENSNVGLSGETSSLEENISIQSNDTRLEEQSEEINSIEEQGIIENDFSDEEQNEFFDNEIDLLLPKKDLINSDLLNEIEGMEFNSIKERTSFDVPDLDDISLPKIKNVGEKEKDVWKI